MTSPVAAYFDVDGTLTRTTTIEPLFWYQRAHLPRWRFFPWALGLVLQLPYYWLLDKRSRSQFNLAFYHRYHGLNLADVCAWHRATFGKNLQRTIFPGALACVRAHQQQGHRVVLLTGGLDCVMQPLADFLRADELIALHLDERDHCCTGRLTGPPIAGAHKAELLRASAERHGDDLAASFAYGDSPSDAAMLECVGHPVAVRPGRRLRRIAERRRWRIVNWGGES